MTEPGQLRLEELRRSQLYAAGLPELEQLAGLKINTAALPGRLATLQAVGRVIVRGVMPLFVRVRADIAGDTEAR